MRERDETQSVVQIMKSIFLRSIEAVAGLPGRCGRDMRWQMGGICRVGRNYSQELVL